MVGLPDNETLQLAAAWLSVGAALLGLVNLLVGLDSALTGRGHWPKRLERIRWRKPASPEDQRRYGMVLALNGAAVLMIILGNSLTIFGAANHSQGEPLNTLRFAMTVIGIAGALTCVGFAYRVSLTVRYANPRLPEPSI